MKTYTLRKELRTPVHCQFHCVTDDTLIGGTVRDLSERGLRVTVERPVPVGLEQPIVITLQEGKDCHHLLVHSAIVRWANGCEVGWEFLQIDELDHTHVTDFIERREREELTSEVLEEAHGVVAAIWLKQPECTSGSGVSNASDWKESDSHPMKCSGSIDSVVMRRSS